MSISSKASSKLAWIAVFFITTVNTLSFADRQLPSIMIPELKADLLLTDTQIGFLFGTVFAIFFGIASLVFGILADKGNKRTILFWTIFMWSILTGLSGFAQQFWDLIIFRIGVGVGEAALGPIALAILAGFFTKEKLPLALGIFGSGPFLGSALAAWGGGAIITNISVARPFFGPLYNLADWRLTFLIFAFFSLILALLIRFLPMPKDEVEKNQIENPVLPFIKKAWKFFAFMFLGVTMTGIIGYSVLAWGVEMLVRVHDLPKSYAGQNFGLFNIIFGIGGSLGFGLLASSFMTKGIKNANLLIAPITLFFCWLSLILFCLVNNVILAQVGLIGLIFFMSAGPGLYASAVQNASPINLRARTASIYYISANVVGFALGPFALGFLNDNFFNYDDGIRYSLLTLGIIAYPISGFCFWYSAKLILPLIEEAENK